MSKASVDTRDTSIQIFDKFVAQLNPSAAPLSPLDRGYFSTAAAVSIIIASKIHDPCPLGVVSVIAPYSSLHFISGVETCVADDNDLPYVLSSSSFEQENKITL